MGKQYSPLAQSYSVFAATNAHGSYPATRMSDLANPSIYFRSSSTTAPVITLDLGEQKVIQAFYIENVNFGSLQIEGSNSSGSGFTQAQSFPLTASDGINGRRKRICVPSSTWNFRYVRLTPSSLDSTTPAQAFWKIGAFAAWPLLKDLSRNVATPYDKTPVSKADELAMGASEEVGLGSPNRVIFDAISNVERTNTAALAMYREIANIPKHRVFLWYDNAGDVTQAYLVQRISDVRFSTNGVMENISAIQLREVL